eukprot:1150326-Pelagomonas_calceolata.AAC.1
MQAHVSISSTAADIAVIASGSSRPLVIAVQPFVALGLVCVAPEPVCMREHSSLCFCAVQRPLVIAVQPFVAPWLMRRVPKPACMQLAVALESYISA